MVTLTFSSPLRCRSGGRLLDDSIDGRCRWHVHLSGLVLALAGGSAQFCWRRRSAGSSIFIESSRVAAGFRRGRRWPGAIYISGRRQRRFLVAGGGDYHMARQRCLVCARGTAGDRGVGKSAGWYSAAQMNRNPGDVINPAL